MNSEKPGLMHQLTLKWDQPQSQKLRDKQQRRRETALLMMTKHDRLRLAIFSPSMIDAKLIQNPTKNPESFQGILFTNKDNLLFISNTIRFQIIAKIL